MGDKGQGRLPATGEITVMLDRWKDGEKEVIDELLPKVYEQMRQMANAHLRQEREDHTLNRTALVHEAYVRLVGSELKGASVENRNHFFAAATRAMRRILVEHARRYLAARRPSPGDRVVVEDEAGLGASELPLTEILAIDEALDQLRETDSRKADVVEMRFFGGLSESEIAEILDVSRVTVARDWRVARMLLSRSLSNAPAAAE